MKICENFNRADLDRYFEKNLKEEMTQNRGFHMCLMKMRHYPTIGMIFSKTVPIKTVLTIF